MRIAVSGAHRTGKTTLIAALAEALPRWTVIDEPYRQLEEEGYETAAMPSIEDFERQLERAIEGLEQSEGDHLFDRCPADVVAYLLTHAEAGGFDLDDWLPRVEAAMARLDLIVFVAIEEADRVVAEREEAELRRRVDEELREILCDDRWGFGVEVLEVSGATTARVRQVLAWIGSR
jgi:predicted ATPase